MMMNTILKLLFGPIHHGILIIKTLQMIHIPMEMLNIVNSFHIATTTTMTIRMIPMIFTLKTRITNGRDIIDYN